MNYFNRKQQSQLPQQVMPANANMNMPMNGSMNVPVGMPPCMMMPGQYNGMPGVAPNAIPQSNLMDMDDFTGGMYPNDLPMNHYNWPVSGNGFPMEQNGMFMPVPMNNVPMMGNMPIMNNIPMSSFNNYDTTVCPPTTIEAGNLQEALELIKEAVSGETEDRLFYEYLISVAPSDEEKNLIKGIRDDEIKHFSFFRDLYKELAGAALPITSDGDFQKPKSYCDGLKDALLGEQRAVQKYRKILFVLVDRNQINKLIEIITDELRHGSIYNYLYSRNKCVK